MDNTLSKTLSFWCYYIKKNSVVPQIPNAKKKTKTIWKYQCFKNQVTKNPEDEEGMQLAEKLG